MPQQDPNSTTLTLGCDPEFVVVREGSMLPAFELFPDADGPIGTDGRTCLGELRPGFHEAPIQVVAKLQYLMANIVDMLPQDPPVELRAGHCVLGNAIGGHIHIGASFSSLQLQNIDLTLSALSNLTDDLVQRNQRIECGYGNRLSYRGQLWGWEYRTPGSWLLNPSLVLVIFALAKLAIICGIEGIDLGHLRGRLHDKPFLLNLGQIIPREIPPECHDGLLELPWILRRKLNWNTDFVPNWQLA